jgi:hypothetical protein
MSESLLMNSKSIQRVAHAGEDSNDIEVQSMSFVM